MSWGIILSVTTHHFVLFHFYLICQSNKVVFPQMGKLSWQFCFRWTCKFVVLLFFFVAPTFDHIRHTDLSVLLCVHSSDLTSHHKEWMTDKMVYCAYSATDTEWTPLVIHQFGGKIKKNTHAHDSKPMTGKWSIFIYRANNTFVDRPRVIWNDYLLL